MDDNSTDAAGGIFKRMAELRRNEATETLNRGDVELHAASLKACGQMLFHLQESVDILSNHGFEKVFPETNLYTLYDTVKPQRTILKLVKVNEQLNELTRNSELDRDTFLLLLAHLNGYAEAIARFCGVIDAIQIQDSFDVK